MKKKTEATTCKKYAKFYSTLYHYHVIFLDQKLCIEFCLEYYTIGITIFDFKTTEVPEVRAKTVNIGEQ